MSDNQVVEKYEIEFLKDRHRKLESLIAAANTEAAARYFIERMHFTEDALMRMPAKGDQE